MEDWQNRLHNWKFDQCLAKMPIDHPSRPLVRLLALLYGDPGWFGGAIGDAIHEVIGEVVEIEEAANAGV